MFKKYNDWYKNLPTLKRLILAFIFNWFYWLAAWLLAEKFFFDEVRSWSYHFFHATFMAFFMTVLSNWKGLKSVVKGS